MTYREECRFRELHALARDAESVEVGAGYRLLLAKGLAPTVEDGAHVIVLPLVPMRGSRGGYFETPFRDLAEVN